MEQLWTTIFTISKQSLIKRGFVHSDFYNENLSLCQWCYGYTYDQYIVCHLLFEMNPEKLHAIPRVQKNQSKSETPLTIFQLPSLQHLVWRGYYVVPFWKAKFKSKESSSEHPLMDEE